MSSVDQKQRKAKASIDADVVAIREALARAEQKLCKIQKVLAGAKNE